MQIKLKFDLDTPLELPMSYRHQVQSAIYAKLAEIGTSDFWHDFGFGTGEMFKFFVFGPLSGNYKIEDRKIIFTDSISLEVRSPSFDFCDDLQRSFEKNPFFKLFDRNLLLTSLSLENFHINADIADFRTVSPILLFIKDHEGRMEFLSPDSPEYTERLCKNLRKKYSVAFDCEPPEMKIRVTETGRRVVSTYKGIPLVAYNCTLRAFAPSEALELIYNSGLGNRNSQGFGMMRKI